MQVTQETGLHGMCTNCRKMALAGAQVWHEHVYCQSSVYSSSFLLLVHSSDSTATMLAVQCPGLRQSSS